MTLDQLLSNPKLPSIPEALLKLNDLIKHTRPISEITEVIERDPSLATRSLELANSAWYKRSRTIATVKDAITTIGLDALHQLVFATSVIRTFQGTNANAANMHMFWKQSLQLACNAKTLKANSGEKNSIHIFTSGLVTYIGKLIIYMNLADKAKVILENSQQHPELQHEEEKNLLGFSHTEISAGLLKKWDLPEIIYIPIQYYTSPLSAPKAHLTDAAALYIAHLLVFKQAEDLNIEDPTSELQKIMATLNLQPNQLPEIQQQGIKELSQAGLIVGITTD